MFVAVAIMLAAYDSDHPSEHLDGLPAGRRPAGLVWVDLLNATSAEVSAAERMLDLAIPSLASLSEVEHSSRMRRENADTIVLSLPLPVSGTRGNRLAPLGFVLRRDVLVTVRVDANALFDRFAEMLRDGQLAERTAPSLLVSLFEVIVDGLADRLEEIGAMLDDVAGQVFGIDARDRNGAPSTKIDSNALRALLRKIGILGQVLGKLRASLLTASRIIPFVQTEAADWFMADEALRLGTAKADLASLEEFEGRLSEHVQFLLDATLGFINMDQNDSFKVLTIVSVVGIPPTLVASIYGMNFRNMPELQWALGYPYGLTVIALSALIPLAWFKFNRWF